MKFFFLIQSRYLCRSSEDEGDSEEEDPSYIEEPISEWTTKDVAHWIQNTVEVSKEMSKFVEMFGEKFKEIFGLEVEVKEIAGNSPKTEQ